MNRPGLRLERIFAAILFLSAGSASGSGTPASARCGAAEYRQFDFWAGDWDAYDFDDPARPSAGVRVEPILDGCVLRETYEGTNGLVGESFSIYDASRRTWHQTWVTNRGQLLALEGEFRDGRMTLRATETAPDGPVLWRGEWTPVADGVRETAETSKDGGKSWQRRFDILFRRRKP